MIEMPGAKEFLLPLVVAFLCGSVLGLERELSHKPAGLRTQALIAIGTTLFVLVGKYYTAEPTRLAANVLTGLGFLGGGVILQQKGEVRGLTTAALIWVNGALGVVIGFGGYGLAAMGTFLCLSTLIILGRLERKIESKCHVQEYEVDSEENQAIVNVINETLGHCHYQDKPLTFEKTRGGIRMRFAFCNPPKRHQQFVDKLRLFPEVHGIKIQ